MVIACITLPNNIQATTEANSSNINSSIIEVYANNKNMPEQRKPPAITSLTDFDRYLSEYINTDKELAILLDYDGTLAPLTDNPNKTVMPVELENTLRKIIESSKIFVAIISGRGINDVKERVGIQGIAYAGNHGIEIELPDGTRHDYELPENIKHSYTEMVKELKDSLNTNNAWVEDKRVSLTYHYRDTPRHLYEEQRDLAAKIIEKYGFRANQAHEAIEAKPPINWNKGEAAAFILSKQFGQNWSKNVRVIFAGDDTTDEDAMRVLQGVGKSFRIADNPNIQTFADYRLPQQALVTDLLKWVATAYQI